MKYHMIAFAAGFLLDLIVGDPYCLPHPIRMIGNLIAGLEKKLLKLDGAREDRQELRNGCVLVCAVLFVTGIVSVTILFGAYYVNRWLGIAVETIMTYQILATKCLKVESMKVYKSLKEEGLEAARKSVSMIVGRDTAVLDEIGVTKAAVETVAENTSDGVIAPMLYTAIGGPVLGFLYKAINTMDSMVGYKNDKYQWFGTAAAKLDDVVNFIPARVSAVLMILAAYLTGMDGK
ncbi:MAG: adenosylcobinamide-phosphate synthase CbiB, partial [Lachnospiraceae bacterium]|nr:adenosylcobinamide-phosphate synthase CbiB [Lachnospiraceae bacterium]